jgi:solute carrier family 35 protein E3
MSDYHFGFPTVLTFYHFLLTWVLLNLMGSLRLFEFAKTVPEFSKWFMGFFGVVSIVTMNFNLKMNSIGFYQLSKLCTIPCMVVYKYFWQNQSTPTNTLVSLALLLVGLCLFTVNDVQFNVVGSVVALVAVITTTVYQTQTNIMQRLYQVTGIQLNHSVSLARFVIALLAAAAIETHGSLNVLAHEFCFPETVLIIMTGFLAVLGNCVGFSLIGRAGPITWQVVGHVKTMTVFVFGLMMFPSKDEPVGMKVRKVGGFVVAMIGVVLYTVFEIRNKEAEQRGKVLMLEEEDQVQPVVHLHVKGVEFRPAQLEADNDADD